MSNLFVYGTLIPKDFFKDVADQYADNGWSGETKEAYLIDHQMFENGHLKCISPSEGEIVRGVLHTNVEMEHFFGLDQYEGHPWLYSRNPAKAILGDGSEIDCFVYVGNSILKGAREVAR